MTGSYFEVFRSLAAAGLFVLVLKIVPAVAVRRSASLDPKGMRGGIGCASRN